MRHFTILTLVVFVLVVVGSPAEADSERSGAYRVVPQYIVLGSTSCDGSAVTTTTDERRLAGGGTAVNSLPIILDNTKSHSLSYKYEAADPASSFTLVLQHRAQWGDWVAFSPAVSVTLAGASGSGCVAIVLPVSAEVRVVRSSDATHATTLNACVLNKF
jgi:hypothetical protein